VEEAAEPGDPFRFGDRLHPPAKERLALGIDEDVGPPQRVLDELEPLGGEVRRVAADLLEIREDLVVRAPVGMTEEGGVATDRP